MRSRLRLSSWRPVTALSSGCPAFSNWKPALQPWIGADRAFCHDVLRYSLSGFHVEDLERMLVQVNRALKRN